MIKVIDFLQVPLAWLAYAIGLISSCASTLMGVSRWDTATNSLIYPKVAPAQAPVLSLPEVQIDESASISL